MASTAGITLEQFKDWMPPPEAVELLGTAYGNHSTAIITLLQHLRGGVVQAISERATVPNYRNIETELTFAIIPKDHWELISANTEFWNTGHLSYWFRNQGTLDKVQARYFNVRFEPDRVREIIGNITPKTSSIEQRTVTAKAPIAVAPGMIPANKGGRPPKVWWEDFWIDMGCLIYEGKIRPDMTKAAIAELMHQWVSDHDYEAGPTVIKDAARKLLNALKK